jgi:citronellol/citronellal dehydrogenase
MSEKSSVFGPTPEELASAPMAFALDLFAGKTVLVSGAGSGIGLAIATLFARLGASLVICGRDPTKLDSAKGFLAGLGAEVTAVMMSIRDPDAVTRLMDVAWERGGLDILVNNAGGQFPQDALDISVKGWNAVIDTNLNGTWYMMQAAARSWVQHARQGTIVNIVADVWRGMPQVSHTCAARAGVIYLSKTVATEWAPHGIRVNCVAPGMIETTGFGVYPPEASARFPRSNPMLRCGSPWDIAGSVAYLAGPTGSFLTGEVITVDGGQQMWGDVWAVGEPDYFQEQRVR